MRRTLVLAVTALILASTPGQGGPADYRDLAQLIQQAIVKNMPREVEKRVNWGETAPLPPRLTLPRLRTYVLVGDHYEVPHGPWWRLKGHIADPQRDVRVTVTDFRPLDASTYRLALDVDARIGGEGEWQQWQKGLRLVDATAVADVDVRVSLVCDVGVALKLTGFLPEVAIDPKVKELHVDLKELNLRQLGNRLVRAEKVNGLEERLEEVLRDLLHQAEPMLRDRANEAIARGLREGKWGITPAALAKATQANTPRK